ncbi:hypothetical protein BX600DRAFT_41451 [Xylariales sp. PMI_506]|nr:hypothetical protein BX600DRAFT_41451 [Xylariales sp. PMI_506]
MSTDPSVRRLLPQNSHLGQFSYAPPAYQQPRETQKNYVFVDEHNRHKRLKVMRACEGCRRRKIKCDAATTNTWPCSACIRLKLHCVRPNGQYDGSADSQPYETGRSEYDAGPMPDDFRHMPQTQPMMGDQSKGSLYGAQGPYSDGHVYQAVPYPAPPNQHNLHYTTMPPVGVMDQQYAPASVFPTPPMHHQQAPHSESSPDSYTQDQYAHGNNDLSDLLGSLKMDETGTAPYLDKRVALKNVEEDPITEEDDFKTPLPMTTGPGLKIRIPPELMPDEQTILHYFDLYFSNVHPYVPVLNKAQFYQQWHTNRESISPLILEAIFAVAGRLADEPALGQQWIAMASKHADAFMDVPRLSTLQALLIILKAREASPKRGYYYRSWMSIVNCVAMAKDLGLDEHYEDHKAGRPCDSSAAECSTKNRIWQTIFICELMIGSPQGRLDLQVDLDSLDFSVPRPMPGGDDAEYHVTRNFTYFARVVRSVRRMNIIYARIKNKKDWGIDPEFVQLNPSLNSWLSDLPADLSITFPPDGSPPWLPSHFIGNLHSYYYLAVIMLHRPQLTFLDPNQQDGQWKSHMVLCYTSAKLLCRLQEAMLQSYGLSGLQCMQRGISFTIYAILTCIVLHIVALTSPDPDLNTDARDYFTRHMRILEKTMGSWPMPEMIKQIEAVREAFSADTRKPFVLKPSFPYGSPSQGHATPPRTNGLKPPMLRTSSMDQVSYTSHPITPPISAGPVDNKSDSSPAIQSLVMMAPGQNSQAPSMQHGLSVADPPSWNPTRIFDQWNTTFGTPEVPPIQAMPSAAATMSSGPQALPPQSYSAAPVQTTFVTPAMWQESVASVYEGGMKRHWDSR